MEQMTGARAVISGRVQGVFFRMETLREAERRGVRGWVRNRPDGTVEAVFEGQTSDVTAVLEWCRQGPPLSKVTDVAVEWRSYSGSFEDFKITS